MMITWRKSTSQALWIDEILLPVFLTASRCPQYIDQGTINSAGHNIWAHHTLCESISQSVRAVGYRIEDRERVMIGVLRGPRKRVQSMYSMGHADLYNYFWSAPTLIQLNPLVEIKIDCRWMKMHIWSSSHDRVFWSVDDGLLWQPEVQGGN